MSQSQAAGNSHAPSASGESSFLQQWNALPPDQRVVHLYAVSRDGTTAALPFVPSGDWGADSATPASAEADRTSSPLEDKLTLSQRCAVLFINLVVIYVLRDLFRLYRRRKREQQSSVIEMRNQRVRKSLMGRASDVKRQLKRIAAELSELEATESEMEARLSQPSGTDTREGGNDPFANGEDKSEHEVVAKSDDSSSASQKAEPLAEEDEATDLGRKRLIRETEDALKTLRHIRGELYGAHGDALVLYIEALFRKAQKLLRRARGESRRFRVPGRRDPDSDAGDDRESSGDGSMDSVSLDPLPNVRPDDWAYRQEHDEWDGGYTGVGVMRAGGGLHAFHNEDPGEYHDAGTPYAAREYGQQRTATKQLELTKLRSMKRVLEQKGNAQLDVEPLVRPKRRRTSEKARRLFDLMKENPGLMPGKLLKLANKSDSEDESTSRTS
ncbi:conserved hypothetical protein [Neospora caninum Liverpool]|nr:conserved hypothetical protein [Neospora caninum Liverpool]CBZ53704.1 conserved hypothetical protein [Neospora caninum Liverpool]|eukprot:XP_003883736.1 conserved hypothetical protein [Neospora caninum Liverpool]